ncbi:type IV secretory system conjugative DNA transfer family protein [Kitasatospora sp. NPDC004723]|uniref:type IV secretory system conjugative DNA transfer family protein n=1 Tax=Kitasatospora sp. NPDC004723 TaxID=3154288 RepID=UPI0033B9D460
METTALALPGPLEHLPGGLLAGGSGLLLVALALLALMANATSTPAGKKAFNESINRGVDRAARVVGRYVAGRDLNGEQSASATWWRAAPPIPDDQQGETPIERLGLKSGAGSVSLAKKTPSRASGLARTVRVVTAPVRVLLRSLAGLWRVLRIWRRWPGFARSIVRLAPLAVAWGLWRFPEETRLALLGVAAGVLAAALTSRAGLGWWRVSPVWTDGQIYGPAVWVALRQALRFEDTEPDRRWLSVPDDTAAEGARIVLRIPIKWPGGPEAKSSVERAVADRVPGEWIPRWNRTGPEHYVEWTLAPKPKPRAKLPASVGWKPSGDARRVFLGMAIEDNDLVDVVVQTKTATPHWGVAGPTGAGKSSVLYIPVVHARTHGELVDILDTKRNSLIEADGYSGVRIHKDTRACVAAFAEFITSMMAAEAAAEKGADPRLRAMLVPRLLVCDELPTLIKLAYTWWRYGIKGKGTPPFLDWLSIILLQGRSSDHRVVIGTQQFANAFFGGTMERAQIGTRVVLGGQDRISWGVAFGQSTPVISYDVSTPGRGAFSDTRQSPDGEHLYVREFQSSYITPQVGSLLAQCPQAPAWFDNGEMAPWITGEILDLVHETAATADFMPGGRHGPKGSRAPVAPSAGAGVGGGSPTSQHATGNSSGVGATAGATAAGEEEPPVEDDMPETYTLAQAYTEGILPWKAATSRTYFKRGVDRGIEPPEGISDGQSSYYSEAELRDWLAKWEAWQRDKGVKSPRQSPENAEGEE